MKNMPAAFKKLLLGFFILALVGGLLQACKTYYLRANYREYNSLLHDTKNLQEKPFLKAHLKDGSIAILQDTWQVDTIRNMVSGNGTRYDFNRENKIDGLQEISIDNVAIFETNKKLLKPEEGRIAALSILAGVDVLMGVICLTNPKACFGSCPTFYQDENQGFHLADAEGFSNAISPSLEYADLDALQNQPLVNNQFSLTMKNEALETHCVQDVALWAFPREKGQHIYQTPQDAFYVCENTYEVTHATDDTGDITALLKKADHEERFSLADANNLSSKESVYLTFNQLDASKNIGLILNFRQTLMTTYFIYSAMGYMGNEVGDIFATIEKNKEVNQKLRNGIKKELGEIEVYSWNEVQQKWEQQNTLYETGPIAVNRQLIPLANRASTTNKEVKIKLVFNKGLWRLDYAALTQVKEKVNPIVVKPTTVLNKSKADPEALKAILRPGKYLISMPGSEYKFNFTLPAMAPDYELFLYSKGYYLEWMREKWLADKNFLKLKQMVDNPVAYLKSEAGNYKVYEKTMEQEFWSSKIDTKTFSYYEK